MTDSFSSSEKKVRVCAGRIEGRLELPSSKSATHRALNLALLAGGGVEIRRPLLAEDTELFLAALPAAGVAVERNSGGVRIALRQAMPGARIECGNAGTLLRFLVASLTVLPGIWVIDGSERLRERPVRVGLRLSEARRDRLDKGGVLGVSSKAEEIAPTAGVDDSDPLNPARGAVLGVALGSIIWAVLLWALL